MEAPRSQRGRLGEGGRFFLFGVFVSEKIILNLEGSPPKRIGNSANLVLSPPVVGEPFLENKTCKKTSKPETTGTS